MAEKIDVVVERVERLERENRSLRRGVRLLWALVCVAGAMSVLVAAKEPVATEDGKFRRLAADLVVAKKIVLADENDRVRGTWTVESDIGAVGMHMLSAARTPVLSIYATDKGQTSIMMSGSDKNEKRIGLTASEAGSMITVGPAGNAELRLEVVESGPERGIAAIHAESPVGSAHMLVKGTGSPSMGVTQGDAVVTTGINESGPSVIVMEQNKLISSMSIQSKRANMMIVDSHVARKFTTDSGK